LLCPADFNALMTLLDDSDEELPDYEPVFKYSQPRNEPRLTVQNYVGIIRTHRGTQIEILPKISKREKGHSKTARDLLIKMLLELEDSPFREGTAADLEAYEMPLFELLMRHFINHVVNIVRKGIARTYVPRQDNLVFLRGKLLLSEHIRQNSANSARVYCEYDEYEANRPINRLIKGALKIVSSQTVDPTTQQRCRELLFWFDGIPGTEDYLLDFQRMQKDRLIQHYMPAMPVCRMILENLNPLTQEGDRQAISMLFPMEKVFEDFVAAKLPFQLKDWNVSSQVHGKSLVEKHKNKTMFSLIPDLSFSRPGNQLIADTKWKLIDQFGGNSNYDIKQSDIYQLFAYSRKFLADQSLREVYLIYPRTDTFRKPLQPFWYEAGKEVLFVVPYDLEQEVLLLPEESSLNMPGVSEVG